MSEHEAIKARARAVAEELEGSCLELSSRATEEEINSPTFCAELDGEVLQCSCCGWWVNPCEADGEDKCEECQNDE